jgi:hypothetical protein
MLYTRRSVLRDATLISIAGAAAASPLLTGCDRNKHFADGIRVFFAGAWIFCADPFNPSLMRAVALNPTEITSNDSNPGSASSSPNMEMNHIFPYGVWNEEDRWDRKHGNLPRNLPSSAGYTLVPYPVTVVGTKQPACNVDQLFGTANSSSRFTYLPNAGRNFSLKWTSTGLRVISLPLPTRIIPAAFRTDARIDANGHMQQCGNTKDLGVATTHIFVYDGASSLTFTPPDAIAQHMSHGTDFRADYHFHTVPDNPCPPKDHDVLMFGYMLENIDKFPYKEVTLIPSGDRVARGASVPSLVTKGELEIVSRHPKDCPRIIDLASCGSGGGGLGDGCC